METKQRLIEIYRPLVKSFVEEIREFGCQGINEPFLPLFGEKYETSKTKIAFVGIEPYVWGDLEQFKNTALKNIDESITRSFDEFESLEFTRYDNNTGRDFWGFIFKFLKEFYNLHCWQELSDGTNTEILKTFAWANTHSIERFHVSAENNGADYEVWKQVQQASKIFDNVNHILKALEPDILVITDWGPDGDSWAKDWGTVQDRVEKDHLIFLYLPKYKCHVVWTAHPRWLSQNTDFDRFIKEIVDELKDRLDPKSLWEI